MSKTKFLGLVIILVVIVGACYLSGARVFVDLPSLLFVAGLTVGGLLYRHGLKGLMLWSKSISENEKAEMARTGTRTSLFAGALGFFTGVVGTLTSLNDLSAIGPYLALSLLSVVYALIIYFIFFLPFQRS